MTLNKLFLVSVPFTSGSSLQPLLSHLPNIAVQHSFSSLYIGILAATSVGHLRPYPAAVFQFPLHRDPRCNGQWRIRSSTKHTVSVPFTSGSSLQQMLRDNIGILFTVSVPFTSGSSLQLNFIFYYTISDESVSVPFTSGSSLQLNVNGNSHSRVVKFQFPLHRDPRCNSLGSWYWAATTSFSSLYIGILAATRTDGAWICSRMSCFSSLYIGILAATKIQAGKVETRKFQFPLHRDPRCNKFLRSHFLSVFGFSSLYIGILAATRGPTTRL